MFKTTKKMLKIFVFGVIVGLVIGSKILAVPLSYLRKFSKNKPEQPEQAAQNTDNT